MTNQLEATLGVLKDVSADAVGTLHHGWEVLGETVTEGVDLLPLGHQPPPSHKGRWATLLLAAGAIIVVLLVLTEPPVVAERLRGRSRQ